MTIPMETMTTPSRNLWRSTGAVLLGFVTVVVLSLGTDQVLHVLAVYPPWGQPMYDTGLLFLALAWVRLDLALAFVLFSVPFYRFPKQFGSAAFTLTECLILACFLVWAGQRLHRRGPQLAH